MATSNPGDTCVYQSSTKFTDPVHQSPGAYAAHWIMWLVPVLPLFAVQWFIKLVCDVLINVVYEKRVYRPFADRTATRQVLDVLSQLPLTLRIGGELFDSRMAPNKLISFTGIVATCKVTTQNISCTADALVTVWRPRWLAPVMPDPKTVALCGNTVLRVLMRSCNSIDRASELSMIKELVLPQQGLPLKVAENSKAVSDLICATFIRNKCCASVYVLHGKPGAGKSISVRMAAHQLGAVLYPDYNPTTAGDNLSSMISAYTSDTVPLVVAFEECDLALQRIRNDNVTLNEKFKLDAHDKASWNKLMDMVNRRTNVILLMTTNRSFEEFQELADSDRSMFRKHRITAHIIWTDTGAPYVRSAIEHSCT